MHLRTTDIADWLRDRVTEAGARGLVVGLSGSLDSATVAGLCRMAMPERVAGVILTCHGEPHDDADARLIAEHFGIPVLHLALDRVYDELATELTAAVAGLRGREPLRPSDDAAGPSVPPLADLTSRLRMGALYFVADSLDYLVAGAINRSDLTLGAFTRYGDAGADVLPIGDLMRTEVRALASVLGVPQSILDRPAEGRWGHPAGDAAMGIRYADLERYLTDGPEGVAPALGLRIERLVRQSERKRARPPTPLSGEVQS
jgi:NAD+ synthase